MGKKKLTEEELRFNEDIKKVVLDILEKNKKPMIKISLSDDKPNLFQSKFGGVPYLPKDMEVPKNKENKQLTLLAQINIEELPKNNIYPMEEGMLQFWILNDDVLGLDYDTHLGNGFKEKYKEILKVYDDKEYLSYWDIWDILEEDKEIEKKLFDAGHKIGGFPNFTQSDIREIGDYEILLLQIDSEGTEKNEIMWGDCGIANFFIREKDLKELNFDKVIYNWDCC